MNNIKPSWDISENIITFYETYEKVGNLFAKCTYDTTTQCYTEHCWNKNNPTNIKTKSWKRLGFEPLFGIDQVDWNHSYHIAEILAAEFDCDVAKNSAVAQF
jgi:hypothetical protein